MAKHYSQIRNNQSPTVVLFLFFYFIIIIIHLFIYFCFGIIHFLLLDGSIIQPIFHEDYINSVLFVC